jgi:CBS domain-containing membrane protein
MLTVAEIMTREPYTLGPDATLLDAAKMMAEHHIRHIPITGPDSSVIGLVSHRDVLAASDSRVLQDLTDDGGKEGYVALSAVMSSPVQTTTEDAGLMGVAIKLRRQRLGCLPVIRAGTLVGIISDSDFLEVAITLLEQMEMTEPEEDF